MAALGFFGKLPLHGDFVHCNAEAPCVRALEEWVSEGMYAAIEMLGSRWEAGFSGERGMRFLLRCAGGEQALAGVFLPSVDRVGRRYPFVLFGGPLAVGSGEEFCLLPAGLEKFFREAGQLAEEGWRERELGAFKNLVLSREVRRDDTEGRARVEALLAERPRDGVLGGLLEPAQEARLYTCLANLRGLLEGAAGAHYVLRYPFSGGLEEVALWMLLSRAISVPGALPSAVCWSGEGSEGDLRMIWGPHEARYFADLFWPRVEAARSARSPAVSYLALDGLEREAYWGPVRDHFAREPAAGTRPLGAWLRALERFARA